MVKPRLLIGAVVLALILPFCVLGSFARNWAVLTRQAYRWTRGEARQCVRDVLDLYRDGMGR